MSKTKERIASVVLLVLTGLFFFGVQAYADHTKYENRDYYINGDLTITGTCTGCAGGSSVVGVLDHVTVINETNTGSLVVTGGGSVNGTLDVGSTLTSTIIDANTGIFDGLSVVNETATNTLVVRDSGSVDGTLSTGATVTVQDYKSLSLGTTDPSIFGNQGPLVQVNESNWIAGWITPSSNIISMIALANATADQKTKSRSDPTLMIWAADALGGNSVTKITLQHDGTDGQIESFKGDLALTAEDSIYLNGGVRNAYTTFGGADASYQIADDDFFVGTTYSNTGAVTITFQSATIAMAGKTWVIKDQGDAGSNSITIQTQAGELIDNSATLVIDIQYASVNLISDGSDLWIY